MAKRVIAVADASQRWGSHITRVNGLIALQAQDIVDEVIGLRGRDKARNLDRVKNIDRAFRD